MEKARAPSRSVPHSPSCQLAVVLRRVCLLGVESSLLASARGANVASSFVCVLVVHCTHVSHCFMAVWGASASLALDGGEPRGQRP